MKKLSYLLLILFFLHSLACLSSNFSNDSNNNSNETLNTKYTLNGQKYEFEPEYFTTLKILVKGNRKVSSVYNRISIWIPTEQPVRSLPITFEFPTDSNIATLHNANDWVRAEIVDPTSGTILNIEVGGVYAKSTFIISGTNNNRTTASVTKGSFKV